MLYEAILAVNIQGKEIIAMPIPPLSYGLIAGESAECRTSVSKGGDTYHIMCVFTEKPHGDPLVAEQKIIVENAERFLVLYRDDFRKLYLQ